MKRHQYLIIMLLIFSAMISTAFAQATVVSNFIDGYVRLKDGSEPTANELRYTAYLSNEPADSTLPALCGDKGSWYVDLNSFDKIGQKWAIGDTLVLVITQLGTRTGADSKNSFKYKTLDPDIAGNPQDVPTYAVMPVELVSFTALAREQGWGYEVNLNWNTASESNNLGFDVMRSPDGVHFEKIGFIPGAGTTTQAQKYLFTDNAVTTGKYFYQLRQIDTDGITTQSAVQEVAFAAPTRYDLSQNYPNPFNPKTEIMFKVKETGKVQIAVFDILGRQVTTLVDTNLPAGVHKISFDGRSFPSGMYLYVMKAAKYHEVKKMALIK